MKRLLTIQLSPKHALLCPLVCLALLFSGAGKAFAQQSALKTNTLYLATATPNAALEFALSPKTTFAVEAGMNPWTFSDEKKLKHWLVQPELRFWNCEAFNGSFWGVHALGGQFNAGGIKLPLGVFPSLENNRYQGWAVGGGLTYGYQWMLSRRWNLELSAGVGYLYIDYEKYKCAECGMATKNASRHYIGPTKIVFSLIRILK